MARKTTSSNKPRTKSEVFKAVSEKTGLTRKEVASVFDATAVEMKKDLRKAGVFTMAGLIKVKVVKKKATKARKGINPFTGEEMMFKAKPARKVVKTLPLKAVKSMV